MGQGNALNALGEVYRMRGDLGAAVEAQTRALQLYTDTGDLHGQANAYLEIGIAYHLKGEYDLATTPAATAASWTRRCARRSLQRGRWLRGLRWSVTPIAVLPAMHRVGLVTKSRDGRYVRYKRTPQAQALLRD